MYLDDEARGEDGLVLPDAVCAVDGLHLRRGGPPRVHCQRWMDGEGSGSESWGVKGPLLEGERASIHMYAKGSGFESWGVSSIAVASSNASPSPARTEEDVVGVRQVERHAARLERDEEHLFHSFIQCRQTLWTGGGSDRHSHGNKAPKAPHSDPPTNPPPQTRHTPYISSPTHSPTLTSGSSLKARRAVSRAVTLMWPESLAHLMPSAVRRHRQRSSMF